MSGISCRSKGSIKKRRSGGRPRLNHNTFGHIAGGGMDGRREDGLAGGRSKACDINRAELMDLCLSVWEKYDALTPQPIN